MSRPKGSKNKPKNIKESKKHIKPKKVITRPIKTRGRSSKSSIPIEFTIPTPIKEVIAEVSLEKVWRSRCIKCVWVLETLQVPTEELTNHLSKCTGQIVSYYVPEPRQRVLSMRKK